jgi:hypothetical protein
MGTVAIMSIEPNARRRLQLVYATTRDPELLKDLRQVLEEDQMSFVPSAELLRDVAMCTACLQDGQPTTRAGLCVEHRGLWNLEACTANTGDADNPSLQGLVHDVMTSPDGGAQFLSAFDRQRRALRLVLEAHSRGVVHLPESIAESVERACSTGPRFLTPGVRSAVPQAI